MLTKKDKIARLVRQHHARSVAMPSAGELVYLALNAIRLHLTVSPRLDEIDELIIETQEPAIRIIDKTGPLHNPADRDHRLQYIIAVPLIFGRLVASDYDSHRM